jgi:hypothetical protein
MSSLAHRWVIISKTEIVDFFRPCEYWRRSGGALDRLMPSGFIRLSTDPQRNLPLAFSYPDRTWNNDSYEDVFSGLSYILRHIAEAPNDFDDVAYQYLIAQYMAILADDVLQIRKRATSANRR